MRSALVTGASGFVGRELCRQLAERGVAVSGAVREASESMDGVRLLELGDFATASWDEALKGVDTVFHLAARVHHMQEGLRLMQVYQRSNVEVTRALARAAERRGVRRFVFVSTVKVHRETEGRRLLESDVCRPNGPYAVTKLRAELMLRDRSERGAMEVTIIRPPLVYGPHVSANFLKLVHTVERYGFWPFGRQQNRRSLVYVGNLADALIRSAESPVAAGQTYLVSDDCDVSTAELMRRVGLAYGRKLRTLPFTGASIHAAARLAGSAQVADRLFGSLCVSIGKIRRELGWSPRFSLDEGLAQTVRWYRRREADDRHG